MPNTMMKGGELGFSKPLGGSDSLETWGLQGGVAVEGWCRLTPCILFQCLRGLWDSAFTLMSWP